jgi:hypothetical protein
MRSRDIDEIEEDIGDNHKTTTFMILNVCISQVSMRVFNPQRRASNANDTPAHPNQRLAMLGKNTQYA